VDNVKFDYVFGKPAEGQFGQWAEGNVARSPDGHLFVAHLWYFAPGAVFGCHRIDLDVAGPFHTTAFASFLDNIGKGRFETATHELNLNDVEGLDAERSNQISSILARRGQGAAVGGLDREQIASLTAKLEQVRRRELLGRVMGQRATQHRRG